MSDQQRRRRRLSLPPEVDEVLDAAARQHGTQPTVIAAQILTRALTGHLSGQPGQLELHTTMPDAPTHPTPANQPATMAGWLQLDRGKAWRDEMWRSAQQLRRWYPDLAAALPRDWIHDRFARDGVFALIAWRRELDTGTQTDPRHEHHWLTALRDFKQMMSDRAGQVGTKAQAEERPPDW